MTNFVGWKIIEKGKYKLNNLPNVSEDELDLIGKICIEFSEFVKNENCIINEKKVKEIIDTKSSFADWLNNQNVRNQLKLDIKICLVKNGYPPQYSPEIFNKVMEQVENFEENSDEYSSTS